MTDAEDNADIFRHVGILGAGAWGIALAHVAVRAGRRVTLWSRAERSAAGGLLPPADIVRTSDIQAVAGSDTVLVVVPAQRMREVLAGFNPAPGMPVVICAKGIEHATGNLMTEVLSDAVPDAEPAILSGPSFARDVIEGLPTAVTIAARAPIARRLQASLGHATFRPYASEDLLGVALGGAAKNVYAIACGIVIGMGLGESARAGLLARSFAELSRFARGEGANNDTLMGLSGFGDLVLTATSPTSRNFSFGLALGRGQNLAELLAPGMPLAEGVETAPALVARAGRLGIELPIAHAVRDILAGGIAPVEAVPRLMARPFRME
jgi:glycerol-3-phosphate dehydrogenase (NAD(P)+)